MHTRFSSSTDIQRGDGQGWWYFTWSLTVVLALALGTSPRAHAKTFACPPGDVDCLIDAINTANANGETNTIRLTAGTYLLTDVNNTTDGPNGLPSITSTLTIIGAGADITIIEHQASAPPALRLLHVAATGRLTLNRLTLQGGNLGLNVLSPPESGGGILNYGTVALTQCTLAQNTAGEHGGGIANFGTLTLTNSTLVDNAGGVYFGNGGGGGIANFGTLTLTNSTLVGNRVIDNSGGGIANRGIMMLTNCSLVDNTSPYGSGGGIANSGTLTLTNSTVARNMAGGFLSSGGGIVNSGTLTLTNTTVVDNENIGGPGGGIVNGGTLTLINSTVAYNSAPVGGGLSGSATLQNTILALNTDTGLDDSPDCSGVVTSLGNNLFGDLSGCTIALQASDVDLEGDQDPGLGDFTDTGSPGNGHIPLLPGSPAIDAGNDAVCPARDQIGQRRVDIRDAGTSRCDIGAIEFQHRDQRQPDVDPAAVALTTP
jgi:hypothetical protein